MQRRTLLIAGVAAFAIAQIVLLFTQVVIADRQRDLITRQTALAEAQRATALNLLEGGRDALPSLRRGAKDARALGRELTPLVAELDRADAPQAIGSVGELARALLRDDRAISTLDRLAALSDRLVPLVQRADAVLGDVQRADTIGDLDRVRGHTEEGVRLQREALAVLRESLAVQRETRDHARSIDRKTGGPAPVR